MSALLYVVIAALAVYFLVLAFMYVFQERLVYFPGPATHVATPDSIDLAYEDVFLKTKEGKKIHGWWMPQDKSDHVVLFFHGNANNISHRLGVYEIYAQLGFSLFAVDYPGYGLSEGKPSEANTYKAAIAAWHYVNETKGIARDKIIIHGQSLGGGIASWLAEIETPAALILEATFTSLPALAKKLYPFVPIGLITRLRYDTQSRLIDIHCPLLIVHSGDDELIDVSFARKLFESGNEPKQFLGISGAHGSGHLTSIEVYLPGLRHFLDSFTSVKTQSLAKKS